MVGTLADIGIFFLSLGLREGWYMPRYGCDMDSHYNIFHVIRDYLTGNVSFVDKEERLSRLAECKECEHFFAPTKQCLKCGCFLKLKVRYEESFCPIGKW